MYNINQLKTFLRRPDIAAMSDADATAQASAPILTARTGKVTFTTLGNVWGLGRAAQFKAQLKALATQTDNQTLAAMADYAITVLSGEGFDPGHPQAAIAGTALVASGVATDDEIRGSQYTTSYVAGDVVSEADVTAARAAIADEGRYTDLVGAAQLVWNTFLREAQVWNVNGRQGDAPAGIIRGS